MEDKVYNNYQNLISIKFAQAQQPKFEERKGKGYIEFGANNDYPVYLLNLFNESPKHGAIIKGKANYIFGKGFDGIPTKANTHGESWNQVIKKCILDDEIYGGYYLQIIYNLLGNIKDVYHVEFHKVRTNKEQSEFQVKNDWCDSKEPTRYYRSFDGKYDPKNVDKILFVKQYNPKSDIYPLPNYFQGLNYIESDVQVSRHILGNAKDGFVATTLINLNGGEPQEEHKAAVEKGIKKKFTGSEGERVVVMFNKSKDNAAEILPLSSTMLTKEDFTNINNLIQQEIFACHQVTSPMLFGIKTEGQLGGRSELKDAYEIFNNTYINERQQAHEEVFNKIINDTGVKGQFKLIQVEPLGFSIKEDLLVDILPREYFMDKLGVDKKYYNLPPARVQAAPGVTGGAVPSIDANGNTLMANDSIKNLTGRQHQNVMRIVRQFNTGKLTKEQAALMLKQGFSFTDEDVNIFLGVDNEQQFSAQEIVDFALLEQFSQVGESKEKFEILSSKPARERNYFADKKKLTDLEANILDLIKKDKLITADVISKTLGIDLPIIEKLMSGLETAKILKSTTKKRGEDKVIEREITDIKIDAPKADTVDILLRYSYDWRSIIPAEQRDSAAHPSRPFCVKMMGLNRLYSRSDIEQISLRLGYSVWDRVGGWWTEPDGNHSPQCRHEWHALTVVRKK